MPVEDFAGQPEQIVGKAKEKVLYQGGFQGGVEAASFDMGLVWKLPVSNGSPGGTEMIFESDQSQILFIGASQIEFLQVFRLGILDRLPEEAGHPTQIVKSLIGTTILVNDRLFVAQRQDAGNRAVANTRHTDRQPAA